MTVRHNIIPIQPDRIEGMHWRDTIGVTQAAFIAGCSEETVRRACKEYGIGRQLRKNASWRVYRPALLAWAVADLDALEAIKGGDRASPFVAPYFRT